MKRFLPLFLILFCAIQSLFSQDCGSLLLNVVSKSNYNGFNVRCAGDANGLFEIAASGGATPYSYSVNGSVGSLSGAFSNLPSGNHTATVRDANGCEKQLVVSLTAPSVLGATLAVTSNFNGQDLSCYGSSNGAVTVMASGGATPYTYSLVEIPSNITGFSSGIFTNLAAGTYSAKVTDNNGCDVITQVVVLEAPQQLLVTSMITSSYNGYSISCTGASDAQLTVVPTGGTGTYVYTLNEIPFNTSGMFTGIFNSLQEGTYSVLVRDLNNCSTVSIPVTIVQPSSITATAVTANVRCNQQNDGALTVLASGGVGAHRFRLNEQPANLSGAASGNFTGLTAGLYTITIEDSNACSYTTVPYVISQPTPLTLETSSSEGTPQNCSDAQISAIASGGTAPYLYELDDTQNNTGIFPGLGNGSYIIHVTDANNCEGESSPVIISQPSAIQASAIVTSNFNGAMISCFGASNGQITITATGGTGFTFQSVEHPENTTGISNGVFTGLGAGNYTFTVSDGNGCDKTTTSLTLVSPQAVTLTGNVTSNYHGAQLTCFGAADGKVTLNAQGGTGSYSYSAIDLPVNTSGVASGVYTGLKAGTYSFTVQDRNACSSTSTSITLTPPAQLALQAEISPDNSGSEGAIDLSVNGGTAPYTFLWNTESTQQNLTNVAAGEYEVEVTDANECALEESFIVPMIVGVDEPGVVNDFKILFDTELREFYVAYTLNNTAHVSVKLFDAKGSLSFKAHGKQEAGPQRQALSQQMLQRGIYIAHVRIDQKLYVKKFIVF